MSDNLPYTITMFSITQHLFYIQDREREDLMSSLVVQNIMWSIQWSTQTYRPQKVRLNLQSQLPRQQDSCSHLHWQLLSHLSISEFSFLHYEWKFPPFPAQRQGNWERKVTIASKSKWLSFGDSFANKTNSWTIWNQTPQPMKKRRQMTYVCNLWTLQWDEDGDRRLGNT